MQTNETTNEHAEGYEKVKDHQPFMNEKQRNFKALYFLLYAAFGILSPYLSLFFESRECSKPSIGVLNMIPNLACMLLGPVWTIVADKYSCCMEMMIFSIVSGLAITLWMLYVGSNLTLLYLIVTLGAICRAPLTSLLDSVVISALADPSTFGHYRLYGALSFGILSLAGGLLLTPKSENAGSSSIASAEFVWIFYFNAGFALLSALLSAWIRHGDRRIGGGISNSTTQYANLDDDTATESADQPSKPRAAAANNDVLRKIIDRIRSNPLILSFSFVVLTSGVGSGVIDAFLFVRLKELGGSGLLLGLSRFITCMAEIPAFRIAGPMYKRYGVWANLAIAQVAYIIRFSSYAFLNRNTVWAVLLVECLHGLTFAVTWNSSCQYANDIAPQGCESTLQSLLESLHWGLGSGLGALGAGFLYHRFGPIVLFAACAILCVLSFTIALCTALFLDRPSVAALHIVTVEVDEGTSNPIGAPRTDTDIAPVFTIVSQDEAHDEAECEIEMI